MSAPLVSVIMPAYNAAATIREALQSAVDQTYRPLEIIVVDDGSTDATADIVQQRFGEQVKLLRERHGGRAAARNTALLAAKGELIQFLDADDLLDPGKVGAQVAYLVDHPGIEVVYGDIECFAADDPSVRWPFKPAEKPEGVVLSSMIEDGFLLTLSALVRAKQCARVGGFDPHLRSNEDWDLWVRIAATGARFGWYPRDGFVGYYRINRGIPIDAVHEEAGVQLLEKLQQSLPADAARLLRVRRAIGRWRFGYGRALLRSRGSRGKAALAMARGLIEDRRSWDYKLAWTVLGGILGAERASGIIEVLQSRAAKDPPTPPGSGRWPAVGESPMTRSEDKSRLRAVVNLRAKTYQWFRYHVPVPLRRALKAVPGVSGVAESAHSHGDLWLPVKLAPGLERPMLLPEAFHWISYDGYEPQALRWTFDNVEPGFTCLDVGGHIGVFSVLMAELVGPSGSVHTFEPFPPSLGIARKTMETNRLADRVTMVQAAVDETDGGTVDLFVGEGTSEVSLYGHATRRATITVPRISLDAYVDRAGLEHIDVIKMDIEGAEERALRGAASVLKRHSPKLLLEVHGRKSVGSLEMLEAHGYRIITCRGDAVSAETFPDSILQVIGIKDA